MSTIPIVPPPGFGIITPAKLAELQFNADAENKQHVLDYQIAAQRWVDKCLKLNKITPDKPFPMFKKVVNPINGYTTFSETDYVCTIVSDPILKPANAGPAIDPSFGVQPGTNEDYFKLILVHLDFIEGRLGAIVTKLNGG